MFPSVVFRVRFDRGHFPVDFFVPIVGPGIADYSEELFLRQRRFSVEYGKYNTIDINVTRIVNITSTRSSPRHYKCSRILARFFMGDRRAE